jgi:hypothetical protein
MMTHDSVIYCVIPAEEGCPWLEWLVLAFEEIDTLFESCAFYTASCVTLRSFLLFISTSQPDAHLLHKLARRFCVVTIT